MKSKMFELIKKELFLYVHSVFFYVASAICLLIGIYDFSLFPHILVIIVPTLTMSLWSNEKDIPSSLPITEIQLVISKWISAFIVFNFLLLISFIFSAVDNLITTYIGIFLYAAMLIAFSSFISLTLKNFATSFLSSSFILAILNSLSSIAISLNLNGFFLKACNYLSFVWHFDTFKKGILDTRNLFFYIILTLLWLFLSVSMLKKQKEGKPGNINLSKKRNIKLAFVTIICLLLLLNNTRYYLRYDFSKTKEFSVSNASCQILSTIEQPLTITWYRSENTYTLNSDIRDIQDFLYAYADNPKYKKNVFVKIINTDKHPESITQLQDFAIYPQKIEIQKKSAKVTEDIISAITLEYLDMTEVIPLVLSTSTLEYDLSKSVEYFSSRQRKKVQIITGNNLNLITDYPYILPALETIGFEYIASNLNTLDSKTPLILLGCTNLSEEDTVNIEKFVLNGGKALFAISPNQIDIYKSWTKTNQTKNSFIKLLESWKIKVGQDLILDPVCYPLKLNSQSDAKSEKIDYKFWPTVSSEYLCPNGIQLFWPVSLDIDLTDCALIIAHTSDKSFLLQDDGFSTNPFEIEKITTPEQTSSLRKQQIVAVGLQKTFENFYTAEIGRPTKLIVIGDCYFPSKMIDYTNSFNNLDFLNNCLLWLSDNENLLEIKLKHYEK